MIIKTLKTMHKNSQENTDSLKELLKDQTLTTNQRRSIAAKILGVHRRYKQSLMIEITQWALVTDHSPASKHKIEQWQEVTFGRSISNNKLADWCKDSRSPGQHYRRNNDQGQRVVRHFFGRGEKRDRRDQASQTQGRDFDS